MVSDSDGRGRTGDVTLVWPTCGPLRCRQPRPILARRSARLSVYLPAAAAAVCCSVRNKSLICFLGTESVRGSERMRRAAPREAQCLSCVRRATSSSSSPSSAAPLSLPSPICTGILSQLRAKLRDRAVRPVRAGCYFRAALSLTHLSRSGRKLDFSCH